MKQLLIAALVVAMVMIVLAPVALFAATDTLTVYASTDFLDSIVRKDTLSNGTQAHHVYRLASTDTTYILDATITINGNVTFLGVPKSGTGKLL